MITPIKVKTPVGTPIAIPIMLEVPKPPDLSTVLVPFELDDDDIALVGDGNEGYSGLGVL